MYYRSTDLRSFKKGRFVCYTVKSNGNLNLVVKGISNLKNEYVEEVKPYRVLTRDVELWV